MTTPPPGGDLEVELSDDDVAFFGENGYLHVERITTDDEIEWLRGVFDELFGGSDPTVAAPGVYDTARPFGEVGEPLLTQMIKPEDRVPELRDTILVRNARCIASRLLDVDADELEHWGHMLSKPPRQGRATPWHQDEAYWEGDFDYRAVGSWAPLDDVDVDNGCLWFMPGSHRWGVLEHEIQGNDPSVRLLVTTRELDPDAAVPVPVRAGGATFHDQRMLHSSRPNVTDRRRRVSANEFQLAPTTREVPSGRPWLDEHKAAILRRLQEMQLEQASQ
jgi:ectoine hydroxylase-related dioxygenase (phytanoyl-CoA dioxygenase family)